MNTFARRHRVGLATAAVAVLVLAYSQHASAATLTVTPNTNLPASANVNVSGTGFTANQPGTLQECRFNPTLQFDECKDIGFFTTNAQGNFGPVPVTVTSTYISSDSTNVNCDTDPANPCRVVATLNNVAGVGDTPISFGVTTTTSTTSTTSTSVPTTTSTSTTSTTSTSVPTTTSTSTTSTTFPTTTSTSTTVPTTTSTSTTSTTVPTTTSTSTTSTTTPPDRCAALRAAQAAFNAQIDAIEAASGTSAWLEAVRSQINALYDAALTRCATPPTGSTTSTSAPPTSTSTSTSTTTPTTTTTTEPPTTTTTTPDTSDRCAPLREAQAAFNAQIDAVEAESGPSPRLDAMRTQVNAAFDLALAACAPAG
jgi:Neocarzinostatin family